MKKQEATEFIARAGQNYTTENNDGHYVILEKLTGRRITSVKNLPEEVVVKVFPEERGLTEEFIDVPAEEVEVNGRLTIKKLAEQLNIDPEEIYTAVRKNNRLGKSGGHRGSRYYFTPEDAKKIKELLKPCVG